MQATPCSHQLFRSYHRLNSDLKGGDNCQKIPAGLPNIIGHIDLKGIENSGTCDGAFSFIKGNAGHGGGHVEQDNAAITFNAANYNSIYNNSETVQPPTISLLPQIKF